MEAQDVGDRDDDFDVDAAGEGERQAEKLEQSQEVEEAVVAMS